MFQNKFDNRKTTMQAGVLRVPVGNPKVGGRTFCYYETCLLLTK